MIKMKIILTYFFGLVYLLPALGDKDSCNYDNFQNFTNANLENLEERIIDIYGESSQGASASVYTKDGIIKVIKSVFYNESGKSTYDYYFDPEHENSYFTISNNYYYISPLSLSPEGKIAEIISKTSFICNGERPDFPGKTDTSNEDVEINILNIILKKIK